MPLTLVDPEKGHYLSEVTSTNDTIKSKEFEPGSWILAEHQTEGKGRGNKSWNVLGDESIIFSTKMQIGLTGFPISLFSLFAASSLLKSILEWYPDIEGRCLVKWPNDIYSNNLKIAGILIETEIESDLFQVILGFGLNIFGREIPNDLKGYAGYLLDKPPLEGTRERILFSFIKNWNQAVLKIVSNAGLDKELEWIEKNSVLVGREIQYTIDGSLCRGMVLGYDRNGFLITREESGLKRTIIDTDPRFGLVI